MVVSELLGLWMVLLADSLGYKWNCWQRMGLLLYIGGGWVLERL